MESDEDRFKRISEVRKKAKVVNYSALYGIGAAKLARETGMSQKEAKDLINTFWEVNWAVREVAGDSIKKTLRGKLWVYNEVSGFWYNLRYEKDAWSTINQSTGVYVFDTWVAYMKGLGEKVRLQYHDEVLIGTKKVDSTEKNLVSAIEKTNQKIKLNVTVGIDTQFGSDYASCH